MRYLNPETKSTDPADVATDVITKAQNAMFMVHRALDPIVLDKVADRLARAEMVYAFGSGGNSSMIASEIQNRLFRLGSRVTASADHNMQLMLTAAARSNDVLIGSSFSGVIASWSSASGSHARTGSPPLRSPRARVWWRRPPNL